VLLTIRDCDASAEDIGASGSREFNLREENRDGHDHVDRCDDYGNHERNDLPIRGEAAETIAELPAMISSLQMHVARRPPPSIGTEQPRRQSTAWPTGLEGEFWALRSRDDIRR
jgi:hypothetical protein